MKCTYTHRNMLDCMKCVSIIHTELESRSRSERVVCNILGCAENVSLHIVLFHLQSYCNESSSVIWRPAVRIVELFTVSVQCTSMLQLPSCMRGVGVWQGMPVGSWEAALCVCVSAYVCVCVGVMPPVMSLSPLRVCSGFFCLLTEINWLCVRWTRRKANYILHFKPHLRWHQENRM